MFFVGFVGLFLSSCFLKKENSSSLDYHLVKSNMEDISGVEWTNAAGKKQIIQKEQGHWYYAGMEEVDSSKFTTYLHSVINAQGAAFSELATTESLTMMEKLTLYGSNMVAPAVITAYKSNDLVNSWLIHSTANTEFIFLSDSSGIYKQIFSNLTEFWP